MMSTIGDNTSYQLLIESGSEDERPATPTETQTFDAMWAYIGTHCPTVCSSESRKIAWARFKQLWKTFGNFLSRMSFYLLAGPLLSLAQAFVLLALVIILIQLFFIRIIKQPEILLENLVLLVSLSLAACYMVLPILNHQTKLTVAKLDAHQPANEAIVFLLVIIPSILPLILMLFFLAGRMRTKALYAVAAFKLRDMLSLLLTIAAWIARLCYGINSSRYKSLINMRNKLQTITLLNIANTMAYLAGAFSLLAYTFLNLYYNGTHPTEHPYLSEITLGAVLVGFSLGLIGSGIIRECLVKTITGKKHVDDVMEMLCAGASLRFTAQNTLVAWGPEKLIQDRDYFRENLPTLAALVEVTFLLLMVCLIIDKVFPRIDALKCPWDEENNYRVGALEAWLQEHFANSPSIAKSTARTIDYITTQIAFPQVAKQAYNIPIEALWRKDKAEKDKPEDQAIILAEAAANDLLKDGPTN